MSIHNEYLRRCNCCNGTPIYEIANTPEDYKPRISLSVDPRDDSAVICNECADDIFDAVSEFGYEDD